MAITKDTVYAQFYLRNVTGELCVNGIPVWTTPVDVGATDQTIPINGYLVSGSNQIDLVLDIEGSPSECRKPRQAKAKADAFATFRLIRMSAGRGPSFPGPSNGTVLCEREWLGANDESEECPRWVTAMVDLGPGFGRWSWQTAPKLDLDVATLEEARVLCEAIRSALRAGDAKELLRLTEVRFRELGEAVGSTSDAEDIAQLDRWIARLRAEPDRVLPVDPQKWDCRLVASDRILVPLEKDWSHAIKVKQMVTDQNDRKVGEVVGKYAVMLARVGDGLKVVR